MWCKPGVLICFKVFIVGLVGLLGGAGGQAAEPAHFVALPKESAVCDPWIAPEVVTTTFKIYHQKCFYGAAPFLITDTRQDEGEKLYSNKEGYEIRSITIYRAADQQGDWLENQPVVFFIHGGAWVDGYADWYSFVPLSFTGGRGWVTVVLDYRITSSQVFLADASCSTRAACNKDLATKAAWYPDLLQDVSDGFGWVQNQIAGKGGDANHMAVLGHSAGAHLATLFALHPAFVGQRPAVKALVDMSGAYTLTLPATQSFFFTALQQTFNGFPGDRQILVEASPEQYIQSGMAFPPLLLMRAGSDLPSLDLQSQLFASRLSRAGLPYTEIVNTDYDHTSEMQAIADLQAAPTRAIIHFLQRYLQQQVYLPLLHP